MQSFQTFFAADGDCDFVTLIGEDIFNQFAVGGIIVDNKGVKAFSGMVTVMGGCLVSDLTFVVLTKLFRFVWFFLGFDVNFFLPRYRNGKVRTDIDLTFKLQFPLHESYPVFDHG